MKLLFLLLIPINLFAQSWITQYPDWSSDTSEIKIRYVGEWAHMETGGSFPKSADAYLEFRFTGYQIGIYTERANHHGEYIVSLDHIDVDTVNVNNVNFIKDYRTWVKEFPTQKPIQHILKLRALDNRPFVLDKFVLFTNSNPNWGMDIVWDTISVINPVPLDSPYVVPVPIDSPYFVPIPIDSPYYVSMPIDSPYYVPVPIDSPYCKKDTVIIEKPCPPVIECPECKPATWKTILMGLLAALSVLFLILFLNEKNK